MNEIEFVIAPFEYGAGVADGLEPVVDGLSLVNIFGQADGEITYAGLVGIQGALSRWTPAPLGRKVVLLGCGCGDPDCSQVRARIGVSGDTVVWSSFWGSNPPGPERGGRDYPGIGPFRFERSRYVAALAAPRRAAVPVRERPDVDALAAGVPSDHVAWLREMTTAFGRDFLFPGAPDPVRTVADDALRAFAQRGEPLTEETVRAWARERRFGDEAVTKILGRVRLRA